MSGIEDEASSLIAAALAEDIGAGDLTTRWTIPDDLMGTAEIVAKESLVLAGAFVARLAFLSLDPEAVVEVFEPEGAVVAEGATVLRIQGKVAGILTAERTALNFLARLSGIATLTREFVARVAETGARITDTRKTTPGWRHLEKWAVRLGGGENHRMGLYDMILVKDNHIAAVGGVREAAEKVLDQNDARLPVEVEVGRSEEVEQLRGMRVNRILLDNMDEDEIRDAVTRVSRWPAPRPELEASGNMTLDRVHGVASTGVDWISVGALTHSPRSVDFSLRLAPLGAESTPGRAATRGAGG
jgi:nicotinate-nucleotide pyrophosphorylase (carboxylating)